MQGRNTFIFSSQAQYAISSFRRNLATESQTRTAGGLLPAVRDELRRSGSSRVWPN